MGKNAKTGPVAGTEAGKEKKLETTGDFRVEVLKLVPTLLWFSLVAILLFHTFSPLMELVKRGALRKVGIATVELEFAEVRLRQVRGLENQGISETEQAALLERFENLSDRLAATSILWVDDNHPHQNASLRPTLASLGVNVDLAKSTSEAQKWLGQAYYDIIITDFRRDSDPSAPCYTDLKEPANAGCDLIQKVGSSRKTEWPRIIVYTGRLDGRFGPPLHADGMTNSPSKLLHLILDAVARKSKPKK